MISWKHSFGRLNEEYELAKKKRQALDSLLDVGKISQSTHNIFNKEIDEAIGEIEKQQKALLEKMTNKMGELENHIKTLEILITNFEIQHVTGEIEEETYQRETTLLSTGLEAARRELETMKEATDQLSNEAMTPQQEPETIPQQIETPQPETTLEQEPPVTLEQETFEQPPTEQETQEQPQETIIETIQNTEETQPETETQTEETQEA